MKPIAIGLIAVLVATLAGCRSNQVDAPPPVATGEDLVTTEDRSLKGAEIRAFLRNSTLTHKGSQRTWYVYLREDGTLAGRGEDEDSGDIVNSYGTWEVTPDDRICRQWSNDWGGGGRGCAKVYQNGEEFTFVGEGGEVRRTRLPGNPKRM